MRERRGGGDVNKDRFTENQKKFLAKPAHAKGEPLIFVFVRQGENVSENRNEKKF